MSHPPSRTTVVIATRDRRTRLLETVARLSELPERPPIVVVDNGSRDGTPAAVRERHPWTHVLELGGNEGPAARNAGVAAAATPYVAFNDDDSWWEPGALAEAERLFDEHPGVGLIAARILVEPGQRLDPTCEAMAASPLQRDADALGPAVLGFVACGAVARRAAFLAVGGFEERLGIGGEEQLLSLDLASAGWEQVYAESVTAHHEPERGDRPERLRSVVGSELLVAWLRRPISGAARATACLVLRHGRRREALLGTLDALRQAPWVLRERRPVAPAIERALRMLD